MASFDRESDFELLEKTNVLVFERLWNVSLREESSNVSNTCKGSTLA